jgi:hypothetical protein
VLSQLPEDWRYSLSSKIKREKKRDTDEAELENYRMAAMISQEDMTHTAVSFIIQIEIQAFMSDNLITSWRLPTSLLSLHDSVVFEVPSIELLSIPFGRGTIMRFIPVAYSNVLVTMLNPSEWFASGNNHPTQSNNFQVEYDNDTGKFQSIKLTLHEDVFSSLIVDAYFAANMQ